MPIYEYRCAACGHRFEVFQKFADAAVEECESCGGAVSKVLHPAALHFKGSGFYTTDYGRSADRSGVSVGAETDGKKPSSGGAEVKPAAGEVKPAAGEVKPASGVETMKTPTNKVREASG